MSAGAATTRSRRPCRSDPDAGLLEIGQGEWEGVPGPEVAERWGDVLDAWRHDPLAAWAPGGESLAEVDLRARSALRGVLADLATVAPADRAGALAGPRLRGSAGGGPVVDRRGPRRRVQGRHAGPARHAARAVLDAAVRPVRDHASSRSATAARACALHNATDHLAELQTGEARARERRPAAGAARSSRGSQRRFGAAPEARRSSTPRSAKRRRWYALAMRLSRSPPSSRRPYATSTLASRDRGQLDPRAGTASPRAPAYS